MAKVGDKIKIIHMTGEDGYEGKIGEITMIDGYGQLHGTWGGCAIIPLIDKFEIVKNQCVGDCDFKRIIFSFMGEYKVNCKLQGCV